MSVSVVSCVYGARYAPFAERWSEYVMRLDPAPDMVIVASDGRHPVDAADVEAHMPCPWRYPQAFYLNIAIGLAETDWVWIVDIDDCAKPDGLAGIDDVLQDVWQMGFERSDGETYVPPQMTNLDYGLSDRNVYVAGSAFRVQAFNSVGGFRDLALQDWDLWRRLSADGASFKSSGRTHFHYMRHPSTRGETELTIENRSLHLEEMYVS